ncbi:MAG: tetratricopeptide repeat protein [Flavobacteriales bacterium]|nr:tetratricopeptide repeat protein [Flavobacteriales bacterium]
MKYKRLLLLTALVGQLSMINCIAQQHTIDSLTRIIATSKGDTNNVNAFYELMALYYLQNPDTAIIIGRQGLKLAHTLDFKRGISDGYAWLGYINVEIGKDSLALSYFLKDRKMEETRGNKKRLSTVLNNIGYVYKRRGEIERAMEYYHKSMKISEEIGDEKGFSYSLNNLAVLYKTQGDYDLALQYAYRSLTIRREVGDKNGIAAVLINIGSLQSGFGNKDSAMQCYRAALVIDQQLNNYYGIGHDLSSIGLLFKHAQLLDSALVYFQNSYGYMEKASSQKGMSAAGNFMADVYVHMGDLTTAGKYANQSLLLAEQLGYPPEIANAALVLTSIYKQTQQWKKALNYRELEVKMRDSMKNEETQKAAIRQQTKYEFEKTQLMKEQEEKEKARLEAEVTGRRDNLQYSVILIALLVLFGGVLSLGFLKVSPRMAEGIIFFSFLILFEFLLVLADPSIEDWSGGAPGIKLLLNAAIAALIFPLHAFFESRLKGRLVKHT